MFAPPRPPNITSHPLHRMTIPTSRSVGANLVFARTHVPHEILNPINSRRPRDHRKVKGHCLRTNPLILALYRAITSCIARMGVTIAPTFVRQVRNLGLLVGLCRRSNP